MSRAFRVAVPLALAVLATDCATKRLAVEHLTPAHVPHDVVGDVVRLTLTYNAGAALGLPVGRAGRPLLALAAAAAVVMLVRLLRRTPPRAWARQAALGLIVGGAVGNLLGRIVPGPGVVDFIDVGLGARRFWIFNVADIAVVTGAALLFVSLWREGRSPPATTGP